MAPRFWSWKEESRRRHHRFGLECTTPLSVPRLASFQSARAMEREEPTGAIIIASRSRYSSVAPLPPCLNSAFHDKDNDIVTWYNPGTRPKRPTPGLERAPRRRLFETRRLEIKRGARALA
ncbi:hypothetical protein BHM03_00004677 [Ensete ventricosum]|uniref:Uncharacterized protein n=1 Tax=Ensete ventricosum TaxID=4639 RepID=A0A445MAP4_ENSVE|nr:hypothetical protein BHM03_00004677 [Ensete ventricosum]